jgi:hypothetical protein
MEESFKKTLRFSKKTLRFFKKPEEFSKKTLIFFRRNNGNNRHCPKFCVNGNRIQL